MLLSEKELDDLDTQVMASVYQGAESVTTWHGMVAEEVASTTKDVTYAHLVNPGKPRKWKRGKPKVFQGLQRGSRKVVNDRYEMTVEADRDELSDDLTGLYRSSLLDVAFENGQKYSQVKDELAGLVFTENAVCMDKAPLFGAHRVNPLDTSSAQYTNDFTGMPFTEENVAKALALIMSARGPDNLPRKLRPTHAMLPPNLMMRGRKIFGAGQVAGTDNVLKGEVSQIIAPELGDDGSNAVRDETWYMAILSGRKRPLVHQTREPLRTTTLFDPRDPNVWERNSMIWTSSERFAIAAGYPWTIWRFRP